MGEPWYEREIEELEKANAELREEVSRAKQAYWMAKNLYIEKQQVVSKAEAQLARCVDYAERDIKQAEDSLRRSTHHCDSTIACQAIKQRNKELLDSLPKTARLDKEVNDKINTADFLSPIVNAVCKELNSHPETLVEDVMGIAEILECVNEWCFSAQCRAYGAPAVRLDKAVRARKEL